MEYNSNIYVTIAHTDCEALNLDEGHRTSNDGSTCIVEFSSMEAIPTEVSNVMIAALTHQEALALVAGSDWTSDKAI